MNLTFWAALPQVQKQLQQLQDDLLKTVDLPNQPVHISILKLLQSGGKFLRPGVFYLFSSLGSTLMRLGYSLVPVLKNCCT
ncbi:hypothetical protein [Secundilactobacillus silagei]|uniref:hypothetical protein n=1 Tax=Secundilactobacillus silagei TaxID=1293415 RepID=UPI0006D049F6|nr:hypothetical protein [Secundilactobacillus silagei]